MQAILRFRTIWCFLGGGWRRCLRVVLNFTPYLLFYSLLTLSVCVCLSVTSGKIPASDALYPSLRWQCVQFSQPLTWIVKFKERFRVGDLLRDWQYGIFFLVNNYIFLLILFFFLSGLIIVECWIFVFFVICLFWRALKSTHIFRLDSLESRLGCLSMVHSCITPPPGPPYGRDARSRRYFTNRC